VLYVFRSDLRIYFSRYVLRASRRSKRQTRHRVASQGIENDLPLARGREDARVRSPTAHSATRVAGRTGT